MSILEFSLKARLAAPQNFIQVILGPRQVGKTTAVQKLIANTAKPSVYVSADNISAAPRTWLLEPWQKAQQLGSKSLLVIDEIQKIENWSEQMKELWDGTRVHPKTILLGSSSLGIQIGLSESLTGRFEVLRAHHWNWPESSTIKKMSLDEFLLFGGYPGSYRLMKDFDRWQAYIRDSIIETVLGRDLLLLRRVNQPALFRQCFELICRYPAQIISLTKLLGQLQNRGNTDLVKHYLELFEGAFLIRTLQKFSGSQIRSRGSSPKIIPLCPALTSYFYGHEVITNPSLKGYVFEAAVGAVLARLPGKLFYWRDGNDEVDFVYQNGSRIIAIEVKSTRTRNSGLEAFKKNYRQAKSLIITFDNFSAFSKTPQKILDLAS